MAEAAISKREAGRSFALDVLSGAPYGFAARLIAPRAVLTWFVDQLTCSNLLSGLAAPWGQAFWLFPQVFISTWVLRMERKMLSFLALVMGLGLGAHVLSTKLPKNR